MRMEMKRIVMIKKRKSRVLIITNEWRNWRKSRKTSVLNPCFQTQI
jgi:hypothetical protein